MTVLSKYVFSVVFVCTVRLQNFSQGQLGKFKDLSYIINRDAHLSSFVTQGEHQVLGSMNRLYLHFPLLEQCVSS